MFEAYSYENLLEQVLNDAPAGIDTRQGSIFFDAVAGTVFKIAKLYGDLDMVLDMTALDTATRENLDRLVAERGATRLSATSASYHVSFTGIPPMPGAQFFTGGQYFGLGQYNNDYVLQAVLPGVAANGIEAGTPAVPMDNYPGLTSATFGAMIEAGTDAESDEDLRQRLREKIAGPAENGNKQHYKTWCEEISGVGRARILPLWDGPNTVKGIIFNALGAPADATVVTRVQAYVDPDNDQDGQGDGLGEGVANLGAHFTASAPTTLAVNLTCSVQLTDGATQPQAQQEITDALTAYLKGLMLDTPDGEDLVARYTTIGSLILDQPSVLDYRGLTLNGGTANVAIGAEQCAVTGGVTVNVL
ncbi:MAG: baseplate J/gp47 family protein [Oscillospiraceae bacterium]|jgi:uncharacterized phage protein gp47/JayE|nr:baseplate J/gp47 family protein [Oscillospiraceae bacterium]